MIVGRRIATLQRAAELKLGETEAITQPVRNFSEFFQLFALLRLQEIQLFASVREARQANAQQAYFAACIAILAK
jgi:hypothetical protein